jgi:adenylosuccinate synthase
MSRSLLGLGIFSTNEDKAINHYTALNLTKLDVLDGFEKIKVCHRQVMTSFKKWTDTDTASQVAVAYKDPASGQEIEFFPADLGLLERCEVVVSGNQALFTAFVVRWR